MASLCLTDMRCILLYYVSYDISPGHLLQVGGRPNPSSPAGCVPGNVNFSNMSNEMTEKKFNRSVIGKLWTAAKWLVFLSAALLSMSRITSGRYNYAGSGTVCRNFNAFIFIIII
jgi:hypothetical protein